MLLIGINRKSPALDPTTHASKLLEGEQRARQWSKEPRIIRASKSRNRISIFPKITQPLKSGAHHHRRGATPTQLSSPWETKTGTVRVGGVCESSWLFKRSESDFKSMAASRLWCLLISFQISRPVQHSFRACSIFQAHPWTGSTQPLTWSGPASGSTLFCLTPFSPAPQRLIRSALPELGPRRAGQRQRAPTDPPGARPCRGPAVRQPWKQCPPRARSQPLCFGESQSLRTSTTQRKAAQSQHLTQQGPSTGNCKQH